MEVVHDVAVIGAGPAGSVAAALLARRGLDVVLIDRDTFPRDKVCGEFLSYDALPVLDLLGMSHFPDSIAAPSIVRCRIYAGRQVRELELPRAARGISRIALDAALVERAATEGAKIFISTTVNRIEGNAVAAHPVGNRRPASVQTIECIRGDERFDLRARAVVGAWGRWGRLDRQLGRPFATDRSHRHFGFKRHFRDDGFDSSVIELHSFRRGYLGVSAVDGGRVNVCGLVHASRIATLKGGWVGFSEELGRENDLLRQRFASPPHGDFLSSDPVIFRAKEMSRGPLFFAGDAAGLLDPLTGNGMAMAMHAGVLVAVHLPEALNGQRSGSYEARYEMLFAPRVRWSRRAAYLLSRPGLLELAARFLPAAAGHFLLARTRAADEDVEQLVSALLPVRN